MSKELTLSVKEGCDTYYKTIFGGLDYELDWEDYLREMGEEYEQHFTLIKEEIERLGWVGEKAESKANSTVFEFSDGMMISFTWRAWGDLMSAIVGKKEGYLAYYM